jgi:beta-lactamase regulating signal transducer with metallopeptidase domain
MSDDFTRGLPVAIALGWALIHLLWQGAVIAAVLEIALVVAGRRNARIRYLLCAVALAAMPVCFAVTLGQMTQEVPAAVSGRGAPTASKTPTAAPLPALAIPAPESGVPADFARRMWPSWDWNRVIPWVASAWLAGVVLLSGRKAGGFYLLWRWRHRGIAEPDDALVELFARACRKIGIDPQRIGLKISHLVRVPMTMGWWRPVVLFPACLLSGLGTDEIELLLAHELAHIRRWDYLANLLQAGVETLFFHHPLTWWMSHRMRQERENCCDDLVARSPAETLTYAKALLRLETIHSPGAELAAAASGGVLRQRIERLLGSPSYSSTGGTSVLLLLLMILGTAATLSVAQVQSGATAKSAVVITAAEAKEKGIAAVVNGKPIFWANLPSWGHLSSEPRLEKEFKGDVLREKVAEARRGECEAAIDRELLIQDAEASGYRVPQKELDDRVDFGAKGFGGSKEAFVQNLQKNGLSLEQFNERNREDILYNGIYWIKVLEPASKYMKGTTASGKEARQELLKAEEIKLENELLESLRAKAVIQRFDGYSPTPVLTDEEAKQKGIAAIVDGHVITDVELEENARDIENGLKARYQGEELNAELIKARKNVLQARVDRWIIIDQFKGMGGSIPKEFADARIDDEIREPYKGDRSAFLKDLAARSMTLDQFREGIEEDAIVAYMREKFVGEKVEDYFQSHLDLFPGEKANVTVVSIKGSNWVPPGQAGSFAAETDPQTHLAQETLAQMQAGLDVSGLAANGHVGQSGKPIWISKDSPHMLDGRFCPFTWKDVETLKPGQTTDIVVHDLNMYPDDPPSENRHFYWILRLNERRPAKVEATPATMQQAATLRAAEAKRLKDLWLDPLRAKAQVRIFDPALAGTP